VFIYDMAGSQYTNFELDLSKKILNLLKVTAGCLGTSGGPLAQLVPEVLWFWCKFSCQTVLTASQPQSTGCGPAGPQDGVGSLRGRTRPGLPCPAGGRG